MPSSTTSTVTRLLWSAALRAWAPPRCTCSRMPSAGKQPPPLLRHLYFAIVRDCASPAVSCYFQQGGTHSYDKRLLPPQLLSAALHCCCRIHGRRRDDLDAMLATLSINAANPVTVMTQDTARSFLSGVWALIPLGLPCYMSVSRCLHDPGHCPLLPVRVDGWQGACGFLGGTWIWVVPTMRSHCSGALPWGNPLQALKLMQVSLGTAPLQAAASRRIGRSGICTWHQPY